MTAREIASAEEVVRGLVGTDTARLLRPVLRDEHRAVVDAVERLPWGVESVDGVAAKALAILTNATTPSGSLDPADDDADLAWTLGLGRMMVDPASGSRCARRWVVHLERLLWEDVQVSPVPMAVAAYAVARFEDALGRDYEVWRWTMAGAIQTEIDHRRGLGLAVVVRAARLLTWRAP